MIIESCILGATALKIGYDLGGDYIRELRIKKEVRKLFSEVMDGIGNKSENKTEIGFKIEELFVKNYGYDAIIMIPWGLSLVDFRKLVPTLESAFNATIIVDYSTNKNTLYMRCNIETIKDINPKDDIRFKLYKSFTNFNNSGQTFKVGKFINIKHPSTEEIIGYNVKIEIPNQLEHSQLQSYEGIFNNIFPRAFVSKDKTGNSIVQVILKPLDNKEKFDIVPCKPYQLYVGMSYGYSPTLLDYKVSPNAIIGGQNGSGKTVGMLGAMINLTLQTTSKDVNILIGSIADKQDVKIIAKTPHCKYYAKTLEDCLKLMKYMIAENARRNKLFDSCKKYTANIFEYNKNNPSNKLPFIYFVTDEIADFMKEPQDNKIIERQKEEFNSLFWKLARQGRSSGCWIVCATQRADRDNLGANVKAQMGNKVCFYQPNMASAQTVLGDGDGLAKGATQLIKANREYIAEYSEGVVTGKTLFLTNEMMEKLLKPIMVTPDYFKLDNLGNIEVKEQKNEENKPNNDKNTEKQGENNEKAPNNSLNLNKLKGKMKK